MFYAYSNTKNSWWAVTDDPKRWVYIGEGIKKVLAEEFNVDMACPLTTEIFLRIVSEDDYERYQNGTAIDEFTPFLRIVDVNSRIVRKINCEVNFILIQQRKENIIIWG